MLCVNCEHSYANAVIQLFFLQQIIAEDVPFQIYLCTIIVNIISYTYEYFAVLVLSLTLSVSRAEDRVFFCHILLSYTIFRERALLIADMRHEHNLFLFRQPERMDQNNNENEERSYQQAYWQLANIKNISNNSNSLFAR